jgi:hypothetical protein
MGTEVVGYGELVTIHGGTGNGIWGGGDLSWGLSEVGRAVLLEAKVPFYGDEKR